MADETAGPLMFGTGEDRKSLDSLIATFQSMADDIGLPLVDVLASSVAAYDCWVTYTMEWAAEDVRREVLGGHAQILLALGADPSKFGDPEEETTSAGAGGLTGSLTVEAAPDEDGAV